MAKFKLCKIDDCGNAAVARELCPGHKARLERYGDPTGGRGAVRQRPNKVCSVAGCTKIVSGRGYCQSHSRMVRIHGVATLKGKTAFGEAKQMIESAAKATHNKCIIWPYNTIKSGYGVVRYNGRNQPAHRVALMLSTNTEGNSGLVAAHDPIHCSSRLCVNPNHLRWATYAENTADREVSGTGFERGEQSLLSKLSASDVLAVRAHKGTYYEIAELFGIDTSHVWRIRSRKSWSHID